MSARICWSYVFVIKILNAFIYAHRFCFYCMWWLLPNEIVRFDLGPVATLSWIITQKEYTPFFFSFYFLRTYFYTVSAGDFISLLFETILVKLVIMFAVSWLLSRRARSQSCPFCRDSLSRVDSDDLWICISRCEIVDLSSISRENLKRLFMYIDKLPLIVPDPTFISYDPHHLWLSYLQGLGTSCT